MIQVRDLVKTFGDFTAVDAISFDVREGEIFAFLGPNGAGKTTTIQMLTTLLRADERHASTHRRPRPGQHGRTTSAAGSASSSRIPASTAS